MLDSKHAADLGCGSSGARADATSCDSLGQAARATDVQNDRTEIQTSAVRMQRDARSEPANSHIRRIAVVHVSYR